MSVFACKGYIPGIIPECSFYDHCLLIITILYVLLIQHILSSSCFTIVWLSSSSQYIIEKQSINGRSLFVGVFIEDPYLVMVYIKVKQYM